MYFVSISMCMCMYVHFMSTGKWRPEIKVRFYFSGALHPISRHCLSLGLELTKLGRLDGLPKAQRLSCLSLQLWDFSQKPPGLIFYVAYGDQPLALMVKQ